MKRLFWFYLLFLSRIRVDRSIFIHLGNTSGFLSISFGFFLLIVFNHFKSVRVILFIFCRFDKSLLRVVRSLFFCLFYGWHIISLVFVVHFFVLFSVCLIFRWIGIYFVTHNTIQWSFVILFSHRNSHAPHLHFHFWQLWTFLPTHTLFLSASSKLCVSMLNPCRSFSHNRPLGMQKRCKANACIHWNMYEWNIELGNKNVCTWQEKRKKAKRKIQKKTA